MTFSLFGALGGEGLPLPAAVGGNPAGTMIWVQNCGLVWVPILVALAIIAWVGMTNLPLFQIGSTPLAAVKIISLQMVGLVGSALGLYLLLGLGWNMWLVLPITIIATVLLMKLFPGTVATNLKRQYAIFGAKHNWVMTWLYVMTFGSFIGYSGAFPLLIRVIFGTMKDGSANRTPPTRLFTLGWDRWWDLWLGRWVAG
jgi:NNP family nitrate/nitrite transporter-like MFS transporter